MPRAGKSRDSSPRARHKAMASWAAGACLRSAPASPAKRRFSRASAEKSVDEPIGQPAAPVADQSLAIDPVAAAVRVLDSIIIAQPRRRGLAPPFGRDPLRPFDAGNVM